MAGVEEAAIAPILSWRAGFAKELIRFLSVVWQTKSVKRIGYTFDDEQLDLWVVLREDAPEDEDMKRIILADRDFRRAVGGAPMDLHISRLSRVKEENLPPSDVIFER